MAGLVALIPLDGSKLSESSLALLPFLKNLGFDKVRLVSVWENLWEERESLPGRPASELEEVAEKGRTYLNAYLDQRSQDARALGFDAETVVSVGRAAEAVIEAAEGVDVILIATHGRTGIARWRLGSVADKIIRDAPCPTLVIGPNVDVELAPYTLKRILVPLDGSEMAEQALPIAEWIAGLFDAEIDLIRVVSLTPIAYDPGMGMYPVDLLSAIEDAARAYLKRKADALRPKHKVGTAMLLGAAGEQVLAYLKENPAGLVVMTTHGRGGIVRAALGSVADRVLHGPSPVLLFRPEDQPKGRLLAAAREATS